MNVALVAMVLLIVGAHFVAAGEKMLLHVHEEKHRLQFYSILAFLRLWKFDIKFLDNA